MITRRRFLIAAAALPVLVACSDDDNDPSDVATAPSTGGGTTATTAGSATSLTPTPECTDGDDPTPAQTEGPYFKTGSPEKSNLATDVSKGTQLTVSGRVLSTGCAPIDKAKIEVWQADADGEYDNSGYTLRGHLFTDAQGRYSFTTVEPGLYPGRTRHIHVMVQKPNGRVLTSQLYFAKDASANASDGIYREELVLGNYGGGKATFDFVLA
jgi:protocatechuate 3,4-dioxygenase beta subunit